MITTATRTVYRAEGSRRWRFTKTAAYLDAARAAWWQKHPCQCEKSNDFDSGYVCESHGAEQTDRRAKAVVRLARAWMRRDRKRAVVVAGCVCADIPDDARPCLPCGMLGAIGRPECRGLDGDACPPQANCPDCEENIAIGAALPEGCPPTTEEQRTTAFAAGRRARAAAEARRAKEPRR